MNAARSKKKKETEADLIPITQTRNELPLNTNACQIIPDVRDRIDVKIDSHGAKSSKQTTSRRVRVVRAGPRGRTPGLIVRVDNSNNRPIGAGNGQETPRDNNKDTPADHEHPPGRFLGLALAPVIVQPHEAHWLEAHEGAE